MQVLCDCRIAWRKSCWRSWSARSRAWPPRSAGPTELAYVESHARSKPPRFTRRGLLLRRAFHCPGTPSLPCPSQAGIDSRRRGITSGFVPSAGGSSPRRSWRRTHDSRRLLRGANVVIESEVTVGRKPALPGVFLGTGVSVGAHCTLLLTLPSTRCANWGPRHSSRGVVIGSDGFGYVWRRRQVKFPQLGKIVIEDDVEIGSTPR